MKRQVRIKTGIRKAYEILSRGIITEMELRMLRKNIRYSFSNSSQSLTPTERWFVFEMFQDARLDLSKEQQRKGIVWLKNTHFRKDGSQRKSSKISSQHLFIIRNFSHFTFEGFEYETFGNDGINAFPIYRTYSKNGMYFDYVVDPSWFGAKITYHDVLGDLAEVPMKLIKGGAK